MPRPLRRLSLGFIPLLAVLLSSCATPQHVYLTWQGDTSTTMTINYHTRQELPETIVHYDTQPHHGNLAAYRFQAQGASHQIPGLKDQRQIHTVELTGLEPGVPYYFAIETSARRFAKEWKFRTIPRGGAPLRFIVGGDMGIFPHTWLLMEEAAALDPQFAVIGGDIAYANGNLDKAWRWDWWLTHWQLKMRAPDGALIPMVLAIGNHEVNRDQQKPAAPFYLGFAAQGGSTYFARTFGRDLLLLILDSGHIAPHGQDQAAWLAQTLEQYKNIKYKAAAYHVPLYPSHRAFNDPRSQAGRQHWLPLFDAYQLDAAFEHHDHAQKRTVPLRNGEEDPNGTVYFGDGAFGVPARGIRKPSQAYLAAASSTSHFWLVDVDDNGLHYRAINRHGETFDQYPEN